MSNATGDTITVAEGAGTTAATLGFTGANLVSTDGAVATSVAFTNAQLATAINANAQLAGKVSASEAAGVLTLNNLSTTTAVTVTGLDGTANGVTGVVTDVDRARGRHRRHHQFGPPVVADAVQRPTHPDRQCHG